MFYEFFDGNPKYFIVTLTILYHFNVSITFDSLQRFEEIEKIKMTDPRWWVF